MATGSGPYADPFVEDEAFANLVARFADAGGMTTEIVLFGRLHGPRDGDHLGRSGRSRGPQTRCDRGRHPRAVAALADVVGYGHVLHIVPGNHDALLRRRCRTVSERRSPVRSVRRRRPPASSSRRGSSTSPAWSTPSTVSSITTSTISPTFSIAPRPTGGTTAPPPALCLDEWRVDVARTMGVTAAGLLDLVAALGRGLRRRRVRRRRGRPRPSRASDDRRPASGASAVAGTRTACGTMPVMISTSRLTRSWRSIGAPGEPLSIVHRLAARAGPDDYMLAAARTVHARCRTPARVYVLGHTHIARPPPRRRGDAPVPQCRDLVDHSSCRTPAGERPPEARRDRAQRCPAADGAAAAVGRRRPRGDARAGLTALIDVSR
jgi:hypothetical protein